MKRISLGLALITLLSASQAFALDGYKDRSGILGGIKLGFDVTQADISNIDMGLQKNGEESHIAFDFGFRLGSGIPDTPITLDLELNINYAPWSDTSLLHKEETASQTLISGLLGMNFFAVKDFYIRAMLGITHYEYELAYQKPNTESFGVAFTVGGGLGYEFFANSNLAFAVEAEYKHTFAKDPINMGGLGIRATWY